MVLFHNKLQTKFPFAHARTPERTHKSSTGERSHLPPRTVTQLSFRQRSAFLRPCCFLTARTIATGSLIDKVISSFLERKGHEGRKDFMASRRHYSPPEGIAESGAEGTHECPRHQLAAGPRIFWHDREMPTAQTIFAPLREH